jgi:hypothetical protein
LPIPEKLDLFLYNCPKMHNTMCNGKCRYVAKKPIL